MPVEMSELMRKLSRTFSTKPDLEKRDKNLKKRADKIARKHEQLHYDKLALERAQRAELGRAQRAARENDPKRWQQESLPQRSDTPATQFSMMPALEQEYHEDGIAYMMRPSPPPPVQEKQQKAARFPKFFGRRAKADREAAAQRSVAAPVQRKRQEDARQPRFFEDLPEAQRPSTADSSALPRPPGLRRRNAIRRPNSAGRETITRQRSAGDSRPSASTSGSVERFPTRDKGKGTRSDDSGFF